MNISEGVLIVLDKVTFVFLFMCGVWFFFKEIPRFAAYNSKNRREYMSNIVVIIILIAIIFLLALFQEKAPGLAFIFIGTLSASLFFFIYRIVRLEDNNKILFT